MFDQAILPALKSLVPHFSSQIIDFLKLNNQYAILVSALLTEIMAYFSGYLSDGLYILFILISIAVYALIKFNILKMFSFTKQKNNTIISASLETSKTGQSEFSNEFIAINSILLKDIDMGCIFDMQRGRIAIAKNYKINEDIFVTTEQKDKNISFIITSSTKNIPDFINKIIQSEIYYNKTYNTVLKGDESPNTCNYDKNMQAVTYCLIHVYKLPCFKYLYNTYSSEHLYLVSNCTNHKLKDDLWITVKRNDGAATYTLLSNSQIFAQFISECVSICSLKRDDISKQYNMILKGSENSRTCSYEATMTEITYCLNDVYNMPSFRCVEVIGNLKLNLPKIKSKTTKEEPDACDNDSYKPMYIYLISSCSNYKLKEDLWITIDRTSSDVTYTLSSNSRIFDKFLADCHDKYESTNITPKNIPKYSYNIDGQVRRDYSSRSTYDFPTAMIAITNDALKHTFAKTKDITSDTSSYKIIYTVTEDIYTYNDITLHISLSTTSLLDTLSYQLTSHTVDLAEYVAKCETEYNNRLEQIHNGKLYCFKYNKATKKFTNYLLRDSDGYQNETFDNIYSEHIEPIKKDIARLKDDGYWKRTGMRRKKSYIFYGEPGCGKNATVLAMALHDNRHIIDIPAGSVETNGEFENILNLTSINTVNFKKNEIIIMFDELDFGIEKPNETSESDNISASLTTLIDVIASENKKEAISKHQNSKSNAACKDALNLGNILSMLDGICNYAGIIIVATTNNKERLPLALCRDLRLTPVYFTFMRKQDIICLVEKFFETRLSDEHKEKIPDRKLSPARCRLLCEKYENEPIDKFIEMLVC